MEEIYDVEGEREGDSQILKADSRETEEIAEEMKEIYDAEREIEGNDQMLTAADSDENEEITEHEIAEEMEEIYDVENIDEMIRSESFDLNLAVLIGFFMLTLTSFGVMYSKRMKSSAPVTSIAGAKHEAEKEEIRVLEPSANASSVIQHKDEEEETLMDSKSFMKHDVSKEFSNIHAPSVELLGEFVFGEEADASNSFIQSTGVSSGEAKSSHMENSTGDSVAYTEKTVKKPRRKNVEAATTVVTPSPVRRSSRLQNRFKSP